MRLEAKIKMGYYPTPPDVVDRIRSFINFPSGNVNVLDPCCGEGLALHNLMRGANANTYGIELDEYRAEQAKDVLDNVLTCSYEDARISNSAFSCLYLNPPYDWVSVSNPEYESSERQEKTFLKGTLKYLQPNGLLVYLVPQKRVTGDIARVLSYRFEDINSYRFPDDEYEKFKQIVLFGMKKQEGYLSEKEFEKLKVIPYETLEEIPRLESPVYDLPTSSEVRLFRSNIIDEAELGKEVRKSALWEKLVGYGRNKENDTGRPLLPLHTGHLGLMLASGYLDGVVGEGQDRHIVRGKVEKITHREQEYKGDILLEKEKESYRVSIKVLKKNGEIITLM